MQISYDENQNESLNEIENRVVDHIGIDEEEVNADHEHYNFIDEWKMTHYDYLSEGDIEGIITTRKIQHRINEDVSPPQHFQTVVDNTDSCCEQILKVSENKLNKLNKIKKNFRSRI